MAYYCGSTGATLALIPRYTKEWPGASYVGHLAFSWTTSFPNQLGRRKNPRLNDFMQSPRSLFDRLRARRLASTFAVLAALSTAILVGSYTAHGVHGQEKPDNSTDATPLKIPNSSV